MDGTNYSLSDLATATGGNNMFGGNSSILIIILFFAIMIMGGGAWNRGNDFGQFATSASQSEILIGQQFQNLDNKIDRIGNGIADATFSLNTSIHNAQDNIAGAVVNEGRTTQNMLSAYQLESQKNVDALRFDMSNYACAINKNIDDKFASLEKAQLQAQINAQAQEINQLSLAQQLCGVVRYPNSWTYNAGNSPFCGYGNGCCN